MNHSLTVLYDGGCGLCGREIAHYRRLPARVPIQWIDVTQAPERLADYGVDLAATMAEFHVFDSEGRCHTGADAFLLLWSGLPYYRHLASVCRALRLQPIMRWGYGRFAAWHFRRRCAQGACGVV